MIQKIKNYLSGSKINQLIRNQKREKRFINYSKANSILILFESNASENNPEIQEIIATLQADNKKVTALGYVHKKEISTPVSLDYKIINDKHTTFPGIPQQSIIDELNQRHFDLLLDLSLNPVIPLEYLTLSVNATLKAGALKKNAELHDFSINIEAQQQSSGDQETDTAQPNVNYLYKQIIFYLKHIQTND